MYTIVKAEQTSWGCPSQWDAYLSDGSYVYMRYRWGIGTASIDSSVGLLIAEFYTHDPLSGVIDLETFCAMAGFILDLER